jgi:serine/threonine protein kinase
VLAIYRKVADALDELQAAGIVHTDINPGHILYDRRLNVRIIDLGRCCPVRTPLPRPPGDRDFAAPECLLKRPVDLRADLYSFAASLLWTITGKTLPSDMTKRANYIASEEVQLPLQLKYFLGDCLQTNPTQRPTTWSEIVQRLEVIQMKTQDVAPSLRKKAGR